MDYGSVMCWAMNIAGNQLEPCIFHIVIAGKPDPPFNCTIQNATSDSLEVNCLEGFDGGLPQFSVLEVYDQLTDVVQANVSSKFPSFTIDGLEAGKLLKIVIYAANAREEVILLFWKGTHSMAQKNKQCYH
ncbi:hypothetical protein WA026_002857 [Henosepilachna vigintioctopunctata]|uniref:Uncharacterized protein n=1 Tax=Henosepilachna vigintioctopunctata TaxID=420089 RepID=A0AAW1TPN3_9CUCU